jgi:hypothetical protein
MKTLLSILTLVILTTFSGNSAAQNRTTDTSATCISFWKNKEAKVYQIRHSKEKFNTTKGNIKSEATYEAHIKVTDSTAEGFRIEWVYKNFKVAGISDNSINSLNAILEGMKIVYKTDDVGIFTELVNWEAVRDYALSNYEKIVAKAAENSEFAAALKQVKAIFQSKENIEALLIREVQLFHSPYGVEYTLTGVVTETELPNVTGGAPFPASVTIKLEELNTKMDYCKVSLNQIVDKGKAGPIMAALLKKLAGSQKVDEEEIKKQAKDLEISDLNSYNYALSSGWVNNLVYKRIANVGISKQIEIYEITAQK